MSQKVFQSAKSHLDSNLEILTNTTLSNTAKIDAIITSLLHGLYLWDMRIHLKQEFDTIETYFRSLSLDHLDKHSEREICFRLQKAYGPFVR